MSAQYDEGHTVAGWTGFGIATIGTAVLGVGVCLVSAPFLAGGLAIVVVSLLVTWALHLGGWGKPPGRRPREQWGMRVRDLSARGGHARCVGCRMAGRGGRRTTVADLPVPVPVPLPVPVPGVGEPEAAAANPGG
ncbi:HGxxPAAW family protein [Streptomyces sp. MMG1533]|uniref:HGxxPAAW family protein n=1 Tax=Streptomyces sp. MMG1533 TaxID=1415546 RepID=UPI0006AFDD41|nr:HGxxPAAW family protein [Streptomyces sp. MMG1533]